MHIYIPLWICWTAGVAAILVVGTVIGFCLVVGLSADNRDIDAINREPYPNPCDARPLPRQDQLPH